MGNQRAKVASKRRGRKSPTSDDADDDVRKTRRERNREAQQVFRKRRQAADVAQKQRIERLENVVENMTILFIDLFDEVIGNKGVLKQKEDLLALVQDSAMQLKTMVQPITDSDNDNDDSNLNSVATPSTNIHERTSDLTSASSSQKSPLKQNAGAPDRLGPFKGNTDGVVDGSPTDAMPASAHGGHLESSRMPHIQTTKSNRPSQAFCLQLLEATLSQACLILAGCLPVSPVDFQSIFGVTLQYRTREEQLNQVRCLLGSDSEKRLAAGMPPRESGRGWRDQHSLQLGFGLVAEYEADVVHGNDLPPGFLTALQVQKQLQRLGARKRGSNTLEVSITSVEEPDVTARVFASSLYGRTPQTTDFGIAKALTFQLNVSLLIANLTSSAKCFLTGPAYPQLGFFKAVEASMISVTDAPAGQAMLDHRPF
ncbi:hypothetical protein CSIM01_05703 [Colletotrichum simmondsii]|uniref:BZIP domain-containing protein n=1 Tax=Colletotrichum simmondsii TaxID=703756 RepID=A0A135S8W1_9PEZI|nr:hypothetical protein CSIM01_05703 [Colletotrichum simmondsii]